MAIAESANVPATNPTTATGASTTIASGSFSPAAGTLVVALIGGGYGQTSGPTTTTVSDSGTGGTTGWTVSSLESTSQFNGISTIGVKYFSSAPGAITVTGTFDLAAIGRAIYILSLTGAASSQTATAAKHDFTTATGTFTSSITTTTAGSYVAGVGDLNFQQTPSASNTYSAAAATTVFSYFNDSTDGVAVVPFKQTALTSTPGATTLGFVANQAGGQSPGSWIALEILPAAATGPATDTVNTVLTAVHRAATW